MSAPAPSMYSPAAKQLAAEMGLRMGRPNLEAFADTVLSLARTDRNVLVVTSDSRGSGKLGPFGQALPKQIVEVGIAEQNLVGVAAGLASCGKTVFAVSPACFLTARSFEQVKNDVAYSNNPVVLVGISAGVSYGALGTTHHSLHDFAAFRAINNLEIIAPADNLETVEAVKYAAASRRPVYLRFGKAPLYDLSLTTDRGGNSPPKAPSQFGDPIGSQNWSAQFSTGSGRVLRDGSDVAFLATGETVIHSLLAAEHLRRAEGLSCRVVSVPSLKPLDEAGVLEAARGCRALVTVEEHMVHGGLGEAVAGVLARNRIGTRFHVAGIPDEYTVTGSQADIFRHYGISMEGLAGVAQQLLKN